MHELKESANHLSCGSLWPWGLLHVRVRCGQHLEIYGLGEGTKLRFRGDIGLHVATGRLHLHYVVQMSNNQEVPNGNGQCTLCLEVHPS